MYKNVVIALGLAGALFIGVSGASAAVISGNYCSVAHIANEPAGLVSVSNWNDFTQPAGFGPSDSKTGVVYDDGSSAPGTTFAWTTSAGGSQNTNDGVYRPVPPSTLGADIDDGHDQLMAGYLQASKNSAFTPTITLEATGLDLSQVGATYSVILYMDGDDDVSSTIGSAGFSIWASEADYLAFAPALATVYGRDISGPRGTPGVDYAIDNDGTAPLSEYTRITSATAVTPTVGNYVQFDGLTTNSFYVRAEGVAGEHGVALNGFQVVPEPATLSLLAMGAIGLIRRRR